MSLELPRFLTKELALEMMGEIARFVVATFPTKRTTFHIVMLVPQMDYDSNEYPNNPITPCLLAEYSHDGHKAWERDYDNIARCKALQLWHDRNDGGTDTKPHLLISGDTPYWGGVKRDGIVVACSGVEPYFDRMIAGMVADACIARSYRNYLTWRAENPDEDFT
jgi:hypothetical protein